MPLYLWVSQTNFISVKVDYILSKEYPKDLRNRGPHGVMRFSAFLRFHTAQCIAYQTEIPTRIKLSLNLHGLLGATVILRKAQKGSSADK